MSMIRLFKTENHLYARLAFVFMMVYSTFGVYISSFWHRLFFTVS